jgi:hypothetical protein
MIVNLQTIRRYCNFEGKMAFLEKELATPLILAAGRPLDNFSAAGASESEKDRDRTEEKGGVSV